MLSNVSAPEESGAHGLTTIVEIGIRSNQSNQLTII